MGFSVHCKETQLDDLSMDYKVCRLKQDTSEYCQKVREEKAEGTELSFEREKMVSERERL